VPNFTTGWVCAVGRLTPDPDQQLILRHTGGLAGEVALAIDHPSVQMLCRGAPQDYDGAYQKLRAARDALVFIQSGGIIYPELTVCKTISDILDLGYDDKERPQLALNLQLIVSYDTSGFRT
jgi:hypothetical protein